MSARRQREEEKRQKKRERKKKKKKEKNCELGVFGGTSDFNIFIDGTL